MPIAVNPQTGERIELVNGKWIPVKQQSKQAPQSGPTDGGLPFRPLGIDTGLTMPEDVGNFMAGMGKSVVDVGRGLGQLTGLVSQDGVDDAKRLDAPLMDTKAGMAGNITGAIVTALAPGFALKGASLLPGLGRAAPALNAAGNAMMAPKTVPGAMTAGAALSGVQPVATDESRVKNMMLGSAAGGGGQLIGRAVGRAINPVRSAISPGAQNTLRRAEALGAKATPGMRTGSATLRQIEAGMESFPVTAGKIANLKEMNQKVLNRAASKAIGENADELSEEVLGRAYSRIGGVFNDAVKGQNVQLGDDFIDALADIEKNYHGVWGGRGDTKFRQLLDDAVSDAAEGGISGDRYVRLRSEMSKIAKDSFRSQNSRLGKAVEDIIETIDDAAAKSMPDESSKALQTARSQWRNLRLIEKALNGDNVSGPKLANMLRKQDPKGFTFGKKHNDLYDMARFADRFKPIVGDSGTATRLGYQLLGGGLAGGTISGLTGGDMMSGAAYGVGAPLAMRLGQNAYLSDAMQKYLQKGLVKSIPQGLLSTGRSLSTLGPVSGLLSSRGSME